MWSRRQRIGNAAEARAATHLTESGLKLVATKFRCKCGEIDLIMRDGEQLVFVEVRYRKSNIFGSAAESVTSRKQQKLVLTAQYYLQSRKVDRPCRFDVVGISGNGEVNWVRNAFGV
jgi:putative endonuclease